MDMNIYLSTGLFISGLLAFRANLLTLCLLCAYWIVLTLFSLNLIHPFSFSTVAWVSLFNTKISYHFDGLSRLFALLVGGIGLLVFIYTWFYTQKTPSQRSKLLALLNAFAISMLGLVLANDMLMLFLCWELTSIISYLLIQFNTQDQEANQAAFNSLFVSVLGSLALLVGFIILNAHFKSWSLTHLFSQGPSKISASQLSLTFYLLLCGVITKSAQFPFYFWLTGAMKAPTPVSAYLHSATMVNAGIYLLARFHPLFSQLSIWYPLLSAFGLTTMTIASLLSLVQEDLKAILAYTTIFALGAMVYLLGGTHPLTMEAFTIFLLFHAIYKAGAFMLVGTIDKEYHTRQLNKLIGVARHRPFLAFSSIIILGAMAGLPPFFGFTIKEMVFEAKLASASISYFLMGLSMLSSMLIAAASFRCLWYLFKSNKAPVLIQEKLFLGFTCPLLFGLIILLFSVLDRSIENFLYPAIQAIIPTEQTIPLNPNIKTSFLLSLLTVVSGAIILPLSLLFKNVSQHWPVYLKLKTLFENTWSSFLKFGQLITQWTQGQSFENQLRMVLTSISLVLLPLLPLLSLSARPLVHSNGPLPLQDYLACLFLIVSSLSLLYAQSFLSNLVNLSLVGFASSFFFIMQGAVDMAITQLLVEVLTIIILLIALRQIAFRPHRLSRCIRCVNSVVALALGFIITYSLQLLQNTPFNTQLQSFYAKNSWALAHGKNVVNVILVDFRSLDTLGEVIVIITTAVAVFMLLKKYSQNVILGKYYDVDRP